MENRETEILDSAQDSGFLQTESVALVLVVGYFVLMSSIGTLVWCRMRRRLRAVINQRQTRRSQRFESDNRVLKIKYFGSDSCESSG